MTATDQAISATIPLLARRWRVITLVSIAGLLSLLFAWQLLPTPTIDGAVRAFLLSVPLLLPIYGLYRGNRYTYRWATLCVFPYFVVGLTEVIANPPARSWAAAMLCLALLWFVSLVAFIRLAPNQDV